MNNNYTDEELVDYYLKTRQNTYFEQLYDRYCHKVHNKCLSFTKDRMQADDLTQDIFLRLLGKLESYKQHAKFSTWLYSITSNYCTDRIRSTRARHHPILLDNWGSVTLVSDDNEIEQQMELNRVKIQYALTRMPLIEQHLLQKKYQEDTSIQELAIHYSLTESAVKMRLKRSRDRLRQFYGEARIH